MVFLALGVLGLGGCEPYMSMTDQIPAQTRRAVALLPETPGYVGMVDVHTVFAQLDDLRGESWADSLRQTENPRLRAFLEATGLDLKRDVQAAYGAIEGEKAFSGVLFASLSAAQLDRYLEQGAGGRGRRTSYRGVPLYRLALGGGMERRDTLSVGIVEDGMLAVATEADRVAAMVDRHRAKTTAGLGANEAYMTLVKRVGHGSTAWLVGRDVVETALGDSARADPSSAASSKAAGVSQAGLQRALATWTDRVLGLSKVSSFEGRTGGKVGRLKQRLREQAVSITLTETALKGQVYLTMRDNASASSVVDVAEGAVAMMKLSADELDERHRDLLDEIQVERDGAIVHIQFAVDRKRVRERMQSKPQDRAARQARPAIHPSMFATRRLEGIKRARLALQSAQMTGGATAAAVGLSTPTGRAR